MQRGGSASYGKWVQGYGDVVSRKGLRKRQARQAGVQHGSGPRIMLAQAGVRDIDCVWHHIKKSLPQKACQ